MALKSTKLNGGGAIGEVPKKRGRFDHLRNQFRSLTSFRKLAVVFGLLMGSLLAITLLVYGYGMIIDYQNRNTDQVVTVCSDDPKLIDETVSAMTNKNREKLKEISKGVVSRRKYDRDQNCLYIVTVSNIAEGNASESRKNFDAYAKIYSVDRSNVNGQGQVYIWDKKTLEVQVQFSEAFNHQLEESGQKLNHPNNKQQSN